MRGACERDKADFRERVLNCYCRVCGMGSEGSAEVTLYYQVKGESLKSGSKDNPLRLL